MTVRLGVVPGVLWPFGKEPAGRQRRHPGASRYLPPPEVTRVPGAPAFPWLGGTISSAADVRYLMYALESLSHCLVLSGHAIESTILKVGNDWMSFTPETRRIELHQLTTTGRPPLLDPETPVAASGLYLHITPLPLVTKDAAAHDFAVGLRMSADANRVHQPATGSFWYLIDFTSPLPRDPSTQVPTPTSLDEIVGFVRDESMLLAQQVADDIGMDVRPATRRGLFGLLVPQSNTPTELDKADLATVQELLSRYLNVLDGHPNDGVLADDFALTDLLLHAVLADQLRDPPTPIETSLEPVEDGLLSKPRRRLLEELTNEVASPAAFGVVGLMLLLHARGDIDIFASFADESSGDEFAWALQRAENASDLTLIELDRMVNAIATAPVTAGTKLILEFLGVQYNFPFRSDAAARSTIRDAHVDVIGRSPIGPPGTDSAETYAGLLGGILALESDDIPLPAEFQQTRDSWELASLDSGRVVAMQSTRPFVFGHAPSATCRWALQETLNYYVPRLQAYYGVSGAAKITVGVFSEPVASGDLAGWSSRLLEHMAATWSVGLDYDAGFDFFTHRFQQIIGNAPLERLDLDAFRTGYQNSLATSSTPIAVRYVHSLALLHQYLTVRDDLSEVRRYNVPGFDETLSSCFADPQLLPALAEARLAGLRSALGGVRPVIEGTSNSAITMDQFVEAQMSWMGASGYNWIHLTISADEADQRSGSMVESMSLVHPEGSEALRDYVGGLDLLKRSHEILNGFSDQQIELEIDGNDLFDDDPAWPGLAKQAAKMSKATAGGYKAFMFPRLLDARTAITDLDLMGQYMVLIRAEEAGRITAGTTKATMDLYIGTFEGQQMAGRLDRFGRVMSVFTGALALREIWDHGGVDLSASSVGSMRDVFVAAVDLSKLVPGVGGHYLGTVLDWLRLGSLTEPTLRAIGGLASSASFISAVVSSYKYSVEAYDAWNRQDYFRTVTRGSAAVLSVASAGYSGAALYLVMTGASASAALGPAALLGLAATLIVTIEVFGSAWWTNYWTAAEIHEAGAEGRLVFDPITLVQPPITGMRTTDDWLGDHRYLGVTPRVPVRPPLLSELRADGDVDAAALVDPDMATGEPVYVELGERRSGATPVRWEPGAWWDTSVGATAPIIGGALSQYSGVNRISGHLIPRGPDPDSGGLLWGVVSPIPGWVLRGTTPPIGVDAYLEPELECWYRPEGAQDFTEVLIADGDMVAAGQVVARSGSTEIIARRSGVVTSIEAAPVRVAGDDTDTSARIRINAVL